MRDGRLLEYIASLTVQERETHKPLIDEALRCDRRLSEVVQDARERLERHAESLQRLRMATRIFEQSLIMLNEEIAALADASERTRKILYDAPCPGPGVGSTLLH